jgi:hypothetical protein
MTRLNLIINTSEFLDDGRWLIEYGGLVFNLILSKFSFSEGIVNRDADYCWRDMKLLASLMEIFRLSPVNSDLHY